MAQSIIANTTIAAGGRAINIALGVITTALITRLLGPGQFGSYVLLLSFGAIVQLMADFGLYLTLTREISQKPAAENEILSQIISLRLVLLVSAFFVAIVLTFFIPALKELTVPFVIVFIGLSLQSFSQLFMGLYQYYQSVWKATAGDLVGRFVQIVSIVILSFYSITINTMVAAFTASAAAAYFIHKQLLPNRQWRLVINWPAWKAIMLSSWPLGAMLVVNAVYFRIDTLILSLYRPSYEVGWYGAAYRIIESALFFPAMFGGLLLPRVSEALANNKTRQAGRYVREGLLLLAVTALYCFLLMWLFSYDIILLIAGSSFSPAAPLLRILSIALVIMFFGNLFGFTLVAMKKQTLLLKCYLGLAVFNTIANLMLIPSYGAQAAAWTTVATELAAASYAAYYVYSPLKVKLSIPSFLRLAAVGVTTFLLLARLPADLNIFSKLALSTILYGALIYITKAVSFDQLALLRSIKRTS